MTIARVTARWAGFPGAPGYSNFHFATTPTSGDYETERQLVHDFFAEFQIRLPSQVEITIPTTVELYDESTGILQDYVESGEQMTVDTTGSPSSFSGASGAVVNWLTNTVSNGRRMRGRTFIVPLATAAYEQDGTLNSGTLGDLNAGAAILSGAGFESGFCVWSRPQGGGSGAVGEVTGHRVPDMAAVLRSRRD